jgi:hypothetical protein
MNFRPITIEASVIGTEQNNDRQLQRLGALRQIYATAKRVFAAQVVLGGPVAVATALLALADPALKGYVALWGIIVALSDLLWLTPWQKRLRDTAARVQESFDCDVLVLPWNDVKAGRRPDPELVREQADKYQKWAVKMPPITNWYAPAVDELPLHVGRVACQRANCWWDSKQRRRYAAWIIAAVGVACILVLGLALRTGLTIEGFVLKVAAPLAPAILLGVRQFTEQLDAASRLDRLKEHSERLWSDALSGESSGLITMRSRGLQDEILDNRRKGPLVFDWVYKRLQRNYELQMNHGVTELVAEAKQRLGPGLNHGVH